MAFPAPVLSEGSNVTITYMIEGARTTTATQGELVWKSGPRRGPQPRVSAARSPPSPTTVCGPPPAPTSPPGFRLRSIGSRPATDTATPMPQASTPDDVAVASNGYSPPVPGVIDLVTGAISPIFA